MLVKYLEGRGHVCAWAVNAIEAERCLQDDLPDVVLLDWMLPGRSGFEFARQLRTGSQTKDLPIIMLTARDEEVDKIKALDVGADDYVTKPFSLAELAARMNALLRRSAAHEPGSNVEVAGLSIDRETRRVVALEKTIAMGPTEFELLYFFMTHRERVYTRSELLRYVWGARAHVEERTVDVHIRRLRKVLETSGYDRLIQTVRGTGYRLSTKD